MGQSSSQPDRASDGRPSRRRSYLGFPILEPLTTDNAQSDADSTRAERGGSRRERNGRTHLRSSSTNRLSQLLQSSQSTQDVTEPSQRNTRGHVLSRTRSTFRDMLRRDPSSRNQYSNTIDNIPAEPGLRNHRSSHVRPDANRDAGDHFPPPRLPSIDISSTFDNDPFAASRDQEASPGSSSSNRRSTLTFNSLRPDRPFRQLASSFRRRRSPQRTSSRRRSGGNEDQATMLSRLLSVAAAATAATLMGDDHQALSEARSLTAHAQPGEIGAAGEDGSFDGFLRALQNGRIASALRQGGEGGETREGPLNFFRMFRFGASGPNNDTLQSTGLGDPSEAADNEARMVPIIIVGIRSINPNSDSGSSSPRDEFPPFMDALGNFPSSLPANALGSQTHDSIDSILRPPQNSTSFRHRRRASMGGLARSRIHDRLEDQRAADTRSPDRRRDRPWSTASSSSNLEPRPPPATPASPSPELSRISSRASTPSHSRPTSFIANSLREATGDLSNRNSILRRTPTTTTLGAHAEEIATLRSTEPTDASPSQSAEPGTSRLQSHRRSETAPSVHYPRFASGHPRRNGVVEPDNLSPLSRHSEADSNDANASQNGSDRPRTTTDTRSWIIYVLGGSYPENHPILTTPSLFTENPTYEDMMLLSALLGPAKAPVASDEDVESAGGLYSIEINVPTEINTIETQASDAAKTAELVAVATEGDDRVELESGHRCLVCLCDFTEKEVCRKLVKCNHLYHKECIDQWLTQGRNSCPLCRGQGVDEKEIPSEATRPTLVSPPNEVEL